MPGAKQACWVFAARWMHVASLRVDSEVCRSCANRLVPALPRSFRARGSRLLVLRGKPEQVLPRVFKVQWLPGSS